jgi:hypothetical protein
LSALFADHNGPLDLAHVYNNTVYATAGAGLRFSVAPRQEGIVRGNLIVTGGTGLGGSVPSAANNVIGTPTDGVAYFTSPSEVLGAMDFYPSAACSGCSGAQLDLTPFAAEASYDRDFNGTSKGTFQYRGAYAGQGTNPGWRPRAEKKTIGAPAPGDTVPPDPPVNLHAP